MNFTNLKIKTIEDFGDQWSRYTDNRGWYGSNELFMDIVAPLVSPSDLAGRTILDIGSGTGRIVSMLLNAGALKVYAIEPSSRACGSLRANLGSEIQSNRVEVVNADGAGFILPPEAEGRIDWMFSIGVLHHIPDPVSVLSRARSALKPGGRIFIWLYGHEGNSAYLSFVEPLRRITTKMSHTGLTLVVELLYSLLEVTKLLPRRFLILGDYLATVFWKLSPRKRKLVIYDQLNPTYAKYYKKHEVVELLRQAGFKDVKLFHRHGYSWSATATK